MTHRDGAGGGRRVSRPCGGGRKTGSREGGTRQAEVATADDDVITEAVATDRTRGSRASTATSSRRYSFEKAAGLRDDTRNNNKKSWPHLTARFSTHSTHGKYFFLPESGQPTVQRLNLDGVKSSLRCDTIWCLKCATEKANKSSRHHDK